MPFSGPAGVALASLLLAASVSACRGPAPPSDTPATIARSCLEEGSDRRSCLRSMRRCVFADPSCAEALRREIGRVAASSPDPWVPRLLLADLAYVSSDSRREQEILQGVIRDAQKAGRWPVLAQALYRLAGARDGEEDAARLCRRAILAAESCGQSGLAQSARFRLAGLLRRSGHYVSELRALDRLLEALPEKGQRYRTLQIQRADALRRFGRFAEARAIAEEVIERCRQTRDTRREVLARLQLGVMGLDDGSLDQARESFLVAAETARLSGQSRRESESRVLAAAAAIRLGRSGEALEELDALLTEPALRNAGSSRAQALLYLGEARMAHGEAEGAVEALSQALAVESTSRQPELRWQLRASLAGALSAAGNGRAAEKMARSAVETIEGLRGGIAAHGEKTHFLHVRADAYTVLATTLARRSPPDFQGVLDAIEAAHARSLREALQTADGALEAEPPRPPEMAGLRRRLASGELLLIYQLGEHGSLLLAVDRSGAEVSFLPPRDAIESATREFRGALLAPLNRVATGDAPPPSIAPLLRSGARLSQMLLGPISSRLDRARRVIVVPDRALHTLPFEALPRRGSEGAADYLGLHLPISYLPAASFLFRPPSTSAPRLLVALAPGPWAGRSLPALENASGEAEAILEIVPAGKSRLLAGSELTHDRLARELRQGAADLHIVAHARSRGGAGPSILLGTPAAPWTLDAAGIAALPRAPRMVVLSACETASGDVVGGEGVLGLVRSFTASGTRSLIASLWPVDDAATAELMPAFYRALGDPGVDPADALLVARQQLCGSRPPHPFYWAGFVAFGSSGTENQH